MCRHRQLSFPLPSPLCFLGLQGGGQALNPVSMGRAPRGLQRAASLYGAGRAPHSGRGWGGHPSVGLPKDLHSSLHFSGIIPLSVVGPVHSDTSERVNPARCDRRLGRDPSTLSTQEPGGAQQSSRGWGLLKPDSLGPQRSRWKTEKENPSTEPLESKEKINELFDII